MSAEARSQLFVYGRLRRSVEVTTFILFAEHATYFDDGRVQARMCDFGSYLGVVLSDCADDRVTGKVYTLRRPTPTLALLDRYEGVAGTRAGELARFQVATDRHGSLNAWVCVFIGAVAHRSRIGSGHYLDHLRRHPGIRAQAID